jgi:hypothetical protein
MSLQISSPKPVRPVLPIGVAKVWLADARILCYRFTNMERVTVDAAALDIQAEMHAWEPSAPWRLLMDMQKENVVVSAYALHRARELTRLRSELTGKTALLTSNVLTAQIASMALRGISNKQRQRLVFSNEAEAVVWLLQDDTI